MRVCGHIKVCEKRKFTPLPQRTPVFLQGLPAARRQGMAECQERKYRDEPGCCKNREDSILVLFWEYMEYTWFGCVLILAIFAAPAHLYAKSP